MHRHLRVPPPIREGITPPRSPQEIDLSTLLPMALQGMTISNEPEPHCPHQNVAIMRGSPSPMRPIEIIVCFFPAVHSLQGTGV